MVRSGPQDDGGRSEDRYGQFLTPKYRDQILIFTKTTARDGATWRLVG